MLSRNPKTIDFDFDLFLKKGYRHFLQMSNTSKVDVDRFSHRDKFQILAEGQERGKFREEKFRFIASDACTETLEHESKTGFRT